MKRVIWGLILPLAAALLFGGCGKSMEQRKMEMDLSTDIMKLHDTEMGALGQISDLAAEVDQVIAQHDSLKAAHPKEAAADITDNLILAKKKIAEAKDGMQNWMKSHKPYDEQMKHEAAMAELTKEKDALVAAKTSMDDAITTATAAIAAHKDCLAKMATMAKATGKGKK